MKYVKRNTIPICLETLKMWVWDIQDMLIKKPERVEDPDIYEERLHNILQDANAFSYPNCFPPNLYDHHHVYQQLTQRRLKFLMMSLHLLILESAIYNHHPHHHTKDRKRTPPRPPLLLPNVPLLHLQHHHHHHVPPPVLPTTPHPAIHTNCT